MTDNTFLVAKSVDGRMIIEASFDHLEDCYKYIEEHESKTYFIFVG